MTKHVMASLVVVVLALALAVSASIPNKSSLRLSEVTEEKLAPHSISNSKLQRLAVGTTNVQDDAITSSKIARYAINERHIAPNTITARQVAVDEVVILLRSNDPFVAAETATSDAQDFTPNPVVPNTNADITKVTLTARTLLKPKDQRNTGQVENHYVGPNGFYTAMGKASGPGIILGWYPSLNGHLLRYQADRALRDISCNAVHTRDNFVRKIDYNMAVYSNTPIPGQPNSLSRVNQGRAAATSLANFQALSTGEVSGNLEMTAVYTQGLTAVGIPCLDPAKGGGTGALGDIASNPIFTLGTSSTNYKGMAHTHRNDPYSNALVTTQYCFDNNDNNFVLENSLLCGCNLLHPIPAYDSGAIFAHSRIWNPNNSPYAAETTGLNQARYYANPTLRNNPVLDTWMLVHRYEDLGFHDKCQILLGTTNGEDNAKCRKTQIWVDREYESNYRQYATIMPSYPYTAGSQDPVLLKERAPSNIRSRDMYNAPASATDGALSIIDSVNDVADSLDSIYPYLVCQGTRAGGASGQFYDRGIPFKPVAAGANIFNDMPAWTGRTAVTDPAPYKDRHEYCFIDGFRDRTSAESSVANTLSATSQYMINNLPPERCSTYTNVGDLRIEAFNPDMADLPGPAEGTPVYSPSLERIEIDDSGYVTIAYAGRGLPGATQPDIAITVVVLLNSGTNWANNPGTVPLSTLDNVNAFP
jgi:hypothetical protein